MLKINIHRYRIVFITSLFLLLFLLGFKLYQRQNFNNYNISLKDIFNKNLTLIQKIPKEKILTIVSTGDVSFAHEINTLSINQYKNFVWPFEKITSIFRQTDISIINLESLLFPDCVLPDLRFYILCGNSKFIDGLKYAGINVTNIANNHIIDYGVKNAIETIKLLKNAAIVVSGVDEKSIMNVKNTKIGFLGFNDIKYNDIEYAKEKGSETIIYQASDINKMVSRIKKMRQNSDILIISFHWGKEYTNKVTERQKNLAHIAIDSGADLILGNHSHWIQPIEIYKNKLIVYSHGSLIFNQKNFEIAKTASKQTKIGLVGKYYFSNNKIIGIEFIPIKIDDKNQPHLAENEDKKQILKMLEEKSYQLIK